MQTKTIVKMIKQLNKFYKVKPLSEKPFKVLVSCILSQRTKDEITEKASKRLLKFADTPRKILKMKEREIERMIYPVGFYRQKAKNLRKISRILIEKFKGRVPEKREELLKLPGVGFKTADVVLAYGFGKPVIPVDTHVAVISRRLGLTKAEDPKKIREDLHNLIPSELRRIVNLLFVEFGKDVCRTRNPRCSACPIKKFCLWYNSHHPE